MAKDAINLPAGFGGLLRYNEEYRSRFMIEPKHVILFVIFIILFVISLNIFFPIS